MLTLYEYAPSGNCYKVRLLCNHLGIPLRRVPVDLKRGEARTAEFKARFSLGRVPILELDDGRLLAESNAILCYLGERTRYVPPDPYERAAMLQWLFWEQYSHEPYVATPRAWVAYFGIPTGKEQELKERQAKGVAALETMEKHLSKEPWFSGRAYGLADIALYAYTHVGAEGGVDPKPFSAICHWMDRVRAQPNHIPLSA